HQELAGAPRARACADPLGVIPSLGDDARRLDQHAEGPERGVELDGEFGLDAKLLGAVTVALLDAALDVAAVAAHVPLADRAGRARHRIGSAHDADDQVAGLEAAVRRRLLHAPERLVSEHETLLAGRRRAVLSGDDLAIGAADAERERARQDR